MPGGHTNELRVSTEEPWRTQALTGCSGRRRTPPLNWNVRPAQRLSRIDATMSSESSLLQAVPFFAVSNMEKSLRFYVDGLRFEMADIWEDEGTIRWCRLVRGGATLMLQDFRRDGGKTWSPEGPLGLGVSIMFICSDALSAYREFTARGLSPSLPFVGNGMWVTSLRDPDGYSVEFESQTDVPEGTTLDDEPTDIPEWPQHAARGAADAAR